MMQASDVGSGPLSPRSEFELHDFFSEVDFDDTPARRYKLIRRISSTPFSIVCAAKDEQTGQKVCIKKILRAFNDLKIAKQSLREVRLLKFFKDHENIISLNSLLIPSDPHGFQNLYLVTELMSSDLGKIIHSEAEISNEHIQTFIYQILRGLKYIHSAGVIHRDLKPMNILVSANCDVKIADFGMGRALTNCLNLTLLEDVTTHNYTAPEGLFSSKHYDEAIDMWSVGCILAELMGRKVFFPGNNKFNQVELIISIQGTPSQEEIDNIHSTMMKDFVSQLPKQEKVPFKNLFPRSDPLAVDMLERMLTFDPRKRMTVAEAISHAYLEELQDPEDEPECKQKFQEVDTTDHNSEKFRAMVYEEIVSFHNPTNDNNNVL